MVDTNLMADRRTFLSMPTSQLFERRTWAGLNTTEIGQLFFARSNDILGVSCPKVGLENFYYPSLKSKLRGAVALSSLWKGEEVCALPVKSMLTSYTVTNSSLRELVTMVQGVAPLVDVAPGGRRSVVRRRDASFDWRAMLSMYILRETARERSSMLPYAYVIQTHDVRNVPMTYDAP